MANPIALAQREGQRRRLRGLKGSYLGDRLTFTAGGYYVYQYNVSVTANDENGLSVKEAVGDVVSKGVVFDSNYLITSNWDVNTGYYHTNSKWVSDGSDLDEVGRNHADVPADILTFASKYPLHGRPERISARSDCSTTSASSNAEERGSTTATVNGLSVTPVGSNNGLREIILPHVNLIGLGDGLRVPVACLQPAVYAAFSSTSATC